MGDGVTTRRWYQNVAIEGVEIKFEDPGRKESKFWNDGKWNNFIKPLLPNDRRTFIEIGCNAGLFLKMAADAGFKDVIGIEANSRIMDQAECFKKHNGGTYKLLQQCIGKNFAPDQLPVADVILLANVHYYLPVPVFSKLVDKLKNRTAYCIVVSAKARRLRGNALHDLSSVRGYFHDWREIRVMKGFDEEGDPAPRRHMYGVSFKGSLDVCNVERTHHLWRKNAARSNRNDRSALPPALDEFFGKVLSGKAFNIDGTLLYQFWAKRHPHRSPEWVRRNLVYKKHLVEDIRANGIKEPIYYDRAGKLLDGIHRLVIAKKLGYKHILVRRL